MIKRKLKDIIIGMIIGMILTTTAPALANTVLQQIDVVLNNVNVEIDGEKLDSNSILYNGSTYLPLRKVAEAVGKDVEWNQETMTANIKNKQEVNTVGDVLYTEEEYQNLINMFDFGNMDTMLDGQDKNLIICIYNGSLSKNEVRNLLNIKNYSNRNEILKKIVDDKIINSSKGLIIQFWYRNNSDNYILGAISKTLNGEYNINFYGCDIPIRD